MWLGWCWNPDTRQWQAIITDDSEHYSACVHKLNTEMPSDVPNTWGCVTSGGTPRFEPPEREGQKRRSTA